MDFVVADLMMKHQRDSKHMFYLMECKQGSRGRDQQEGDGK
jgi:hypothetical protein